MKVKTFKINFLSILTILSKEKKTLKIGSTMYSACYFAFMKDIKKKHKWTEAD